MIRATLHYEKSRGMVHGDMQRMVLEELKKSIGI